MTRLLLTILCMAFTSTAFAQIEIKVHPEDSLQAAIERTRGNQTYRIKLLPGVHRIEEPIVLTPEDFDLQLAGTPGKTIISGGRQITGWKPYKNGIWMTEIPAVKSGDWSFRELYVNGKRQQRAKTPNEGFYRVAGCPEGTPKTVGYHTDCQSFEFKPGDIRPDWKNLGDVNVIVYYFWTDNHLPIESVDTEKNIVRFKHKGGKTFTDDFTEDGARYVVENCFEALDQPGEWYLDKPEGVLYYMPKEGEDLSKVEVIAPFAKELLRIQGDPSKRRIDEGIHFKDIIFEYCNFELPPGKANDSQGSSEVAAAVNLTGVVDCSFTQCVFSRLGTYAIDMKAGCRDNSIRSCRFDDLAAGGIRMSGGGAGSDPRSHTKNNILLDNEISRYGQIYPSAVGIIIQHGYGNTIAKNHIHHGYYTGISLGWNWGYGRSISQNNIVECNHIHHIGQGLLSDMGAVYTLGPSYGTIIRNNLIHDIDANRYGGWGIYNDEGSTGILVENNVVYNTKFAGYDMHYGKEITVRNNIFALGRMEQLSRTRGEDHPSLYFENNIVYWKEGELFKGNWKDREYVYYVNPIRKEQPKYTRNFWMNRNVYFNPNKKIEDVKFAGASFEDWKKRGYDTASVYADPMFVDPDKYDFRLKPESPALKLGFEQIDLNGVPGR